MAQIAKDRLTVDLDSGQRKMLDKLAADRGWSTGKCVREILAEYFARLQQQQGELTP